MFHEGDILMFGEKCLNYSDFYVLICAGKLGCYNLVSEQVGPSGQVVESSSIVTAEYCP